MAAWILVPCLVSLRDEFNALAPARDHESDGSIGDQAHADRPSDHNPDETGATPSEDADRLNEVHAIDVDVDLRRPGWTMQRAVQIIVSRHRVGHDTRLQNVIYNRRIWSRSWGWTARAYTGPNPHDHHAHFGSRYDTASEQNTRPWGLLAALEDEDDMDQPTFNTRMDVWWNARMSPNAADNPQRKALRAAAWQQPVGRTDRSTHDVLFGDMRVTLAKAAGLSSEDIAQDVIEGLVGVDPNPDRIADVLRTVLGDQAGEVGRLLAGQ